MKILRNNRLIDASPAEEARLNAKRKRMADRERLSLSEGQKRSDAMVKLRNMGLNNDDIEALWGLS